MNPSSSPSPDPLALQTAMAPRYEICVGLEKGHKTTPNTLKAKPSSAKVRLDLF